MTFLCALVPSWLHDSKKAAAAALGAMATALLCGCVVQPPRVFPQEAVPPPVLEHGLDTEALLHAPEAYLYDRAALAEVERATGKPDPRITTFAHAYLRRLYGNPAYMYRIWEERSLANGRPEERMFCREFLTRLDVALLEYLISVAEEDDQERSAWETLQDIGPACEALLGTPSVDVESSPEPRP